MKRITTFGFAPHSFVFAVIVCACSPAARAQFREFQAPPQLQPPPGAKPLLTLAAGEGCKPEAFVSLEGSIVKVDLHYTFGSWNIFNPNAGTSRKPVSPKDQNAGGYDPVELRSYGGCPSGPVIDIKPGSTLRVDLHNDLDPDDPSCLPVPPAGLSMPPGVGCFNTVNLHTHGLHVSPTGNSDNVLLSIAPHTEFNYEINIPSDHPSGTFWYHAHRHGSTALQVASGASGLLIVRGDRPYAAPTSGDPTPPPGDIDTILQVPDEASTVKKIPEQLFLFQQIAYACFNNPPHRKGGDWQQIYTTTGYFSNTKEGQANANSPWTCALPKNNADASVGRVENFALQLGSATVWDTSGRFTSVNGVVQPRLTVKAGEIQRWRFAHAGIHDTINLQVVKEAGGGTALTALAPISGNRTDQIGEVMRRCAATESSLVPQFEIANDGLTRNHIREMSGSKEIAAQGSNYLQPGYRSDVLIVFPSEGDYCLLNQASPASEQEHNGAKIPNGQGPSTLQLLAYVHVAGGNAVTTNLRDYVEKALYDGNPQLPEPVRSGLLKGDLTPWTPMKELPPPTPGHVQQAGFNITADNLGVYFQVNGQSYNPDVVNITRQVNTIDDWTLTAVGEPHIFHIHVNPFEIMDVLELQSDGSLKSIYDANGNCNDMVLKDQLGIQYCGMFHEFRDTVFVEQNFQVNTRTYYDRYIGEFVIHCHILDHEDSGMMLNINIVPDMSAPGGGLGMAGMRHNH